MANNYYQKTKKDFQKRLVTGKIVSSGYNNKSFKKIFKSSGPKMDSWGTSAFVSDNKL